MPEKKEKEQQEEKTDTEERVMPFLDHLEELRQRLLRSILSIVLFSVGSYFISKQIMQLLLRPYPHDKKLIFLAPTEGFIVHIKVAVFAGIILSLPVIFYQLWHFISPGLYKKEQRYIPMIVLFSVFFFLTGAFFCYFIIIPFGLNFLLSFNTEQLEASIQIKEYLKFVTLLIMVFGAIFELPLLSYFLTKMGILTPEFMRKNRRYGIVLIFVCAAILTPPDIVTQLFLAGPLILLYEISIWVSKSVYHKPDEENDDS
ncbi:MAG: twin-arginine translocase subunit TatC [Bacteroidales bacterium]|nr:twin-arginine translocase subunit TatC [Bacteroidales bacterium]